MISCMQRRGELKSERTQKKVRRVTRVSLEQPETRARYLSEAIMAGAVPVNATLLAPSRSRDTPEFVARGTYLNRVFACVDCEAEEVWTATQQKWWYEVAKGELFTTARRCRSCRRRERDRKAEARRVHLEGLARKKARKDTD